MKQTQRLSLRLVLTGLVIATGFAAQAASDGGAQRAGQMRPSFELLDADNSGALSRDEFEAHAKARFARADSNGDGVLDAQELAQMGPKHKERRTERMLQRMDADGDGALSLAELGAGGPRRGDPFAMLDKNGDGAVTAEEFAQMKRHPGKQAMHKGKPATD